MKEDMGKIQKDNKQGVVCIRCVRVLCSVTINAVKVNIRLINNLLIMLLFLFYIICRTNNI